jgi:hypothetical protein
MSVLSHLHELFNAEPVPSVHPYTPVERASAALSPVPEPPHWPLGHLPLSPRVQTLLVL